MSMWGQFRPNNPVSQDDDFPSLGGIVPERKPVGKDHDHRLII